MKALFTKRCQRCGLHYPARLTTCPHCAGLSDEQLKHIRAKHRAGGGYAYLGRLVIYIAGLILTIIVIYKLDHL